MTQGLNRTWPHDPEAERYVLGVLLTNPEAVKELGAIVRDEDFHVLGHREVYQAMQALWARSAPVDEISLATELRERGARGIGEAGAEALVAELLDYMGLGGSLEYYARRVSDLAQQRELIACAAEIQSMAFDRRDTEAVLSDAERELLKVTQRRDGGGPVHASVAVDEAIALQGEDRPVWSTGFSALNRILDGGLRGGDLTIVGARPSMGKTSFLLTVALQVAKSGTPVGFFSLEEPKYRIVNKMTSAQGGVLNTSVDSGRFADEEEELRAFHARDVVYDLPLYIDDAPTRTVHDVASWTRRLVTRHGVQVVFLDYLQRLSIPGGLVRESDKRLAVEDMSRGLKNLARELDIAVVCSAQLNRKVESRTDKRPMMSDLKEAGGIEQDADLVVLLYRPSYYEPNPEPKPEDPGAYQELCYAIVAKQRNGPTGDVKLKFERQYSRFQDRPWTPPGGGDA